MTVALMTTAHVASWTPEYAVNWLAIAGSCRPMSVNAKPLIV